MESPVYHFSIGLDDSKLVRAAQAGDRRAMETLLGRHYDRVYAVCARVTNNDSDAADATQNALLAIVRGLDSFDHRSQFSTWAYRVATNSALDELRRRKRRPVPSDPPSEIQGPDTHHDQLIVDRISIDAALSHLPDEFRIPVVLRDLVGMGYAEIAEALELPAGTVRSRIARGRRRLAEILGNQKASRGRHSE